MGFLSSLFGSAFSSSSSSDINSEDYRPAGGNIDNTPAVHTVYSDTLGPDPEHNTVISQGDDFDYHLKRACHWDSKEKLDSILIQFPQSRERMFEHIRCHRNPNLLLKMLSDLPDKSPLMAEIEALGLDALTINEINRVGADGLAPIVVIGGINGMHHAIAAFAAKGFCLDVVDASGMTALINAAKHGQMTNVKALLDNGAQNLDQQDAAGLTALHYAAQNTCAEIVEMLLDAGAVVNTASKDNMMPIHMATMSAVSAGYTSQSPNFVDWSKDEGRRCVELLRDRGADMQAMCGYGFSAEQMLPAIFA